MKEYKEFTFAWLIFVFVVPIHILITYLYINNIGEIAIKTNPYLILTLTFLLIYILFYGMTTKVNSGKITVSFGIGLIRKKIHLKRVKSVEAVKSPWYYGWGIRIIPNGILYNISGTGGVELKFKDTHRIIRIGTKDSLNLKKIINSHIS